MEKESAGQIGASASSVSYNTKQFSVVFATMGTIDLVILVACVYRCVVLCRGQHRSRHAAETQEPLTDTPSPAQVDIKPKTLFFFLLAIAMLCLPSSFIFVHPFLLHVTMLLFAMVKQSTRWCTL